MRYFPRRNALMNEVAPQNIPPMSVTSRGNVLVEEICTTKHEAHVSDTQHTPGGNVMVERKKEPLASSKHALMDWQQSFETSDSFHRSATLPWMMHSHIVSAQVCIVSWHFLFQLTPGCLPWKNDLISCTFATRSLLEAMTGGRGPMTVTRRP